MQILVLDLRRGRRRWGLGISLGEGTGGMVVVYPAWRGKGEGVEFVVTMERGAVEGLKGGDEGGGRWFEFRGEEGEKRERTR